MSYTINIIENLNNNLDLTLSRNFTQIELDFLIKFTNILPYHQIPSSWKTQDNTLITLINYIDDIKLISEDYFSLKYNNISKSNIHNSYNYNNYIKNIEKIFPSAESCDYHLLFCFLAKTHSFDWTFSKNLFILMMSR